jgi:polysaccharide export outer membrane protein
MSLFRSIVVALIAVAPALLGCSATSQSQSGEKSGPAVQAPAGQVPAGQAGTDYLIGPGDTLQIFVWQSPDLSGTVTVRPDGRISTPLVEDMVAVGKTPANLATDLQTALAAFIRSPEVSVIVSTALGTLSQVQVIGQVTTPSAVPYRAGLTVLDVLLQVGGLTEFAAPNRATLIRTENFQERKIKVRIGDLLDDGDLSQNLALKPGDVIVIPQTRF